MVQHFLLRRAHGTRHYRKKNEDHRALKALDSSSPCPRGFRFISLHQVQASNKIIPDTSRRQPPTPQDFGCISFVWGLSREICQKVDVVWFQNCRACGEVVSWETPPSSWVAGSCRQVDYRSHIGVILGPSLAILWVMLKLSRAMVGHAEAICQMLFGHVVGFVSQSAPPEAQRFLVGFGKPCWIHLGVK